MITRYEAEIDQDTHLSVLKMIADSLAESVMITEAAAHITDPKILYVNPAFTQLTGYTLHEAVNETPKLLQGRKTERVVLDRLKDELATRQLWKGKTYNYTKAGQAFMMEWEIVPIYDTVGALRFYVTVQRRADDSGDGSQRRLDALHRWNDRSHLLED